MVQSKHVKLKRGRWFRMTRTPALLELARDRRTYTSLDKSILMLFGCCADDDNCLSLTVREFAEELGCTPANASISLSKLIKLGWVKRLRPGVYQAADRLMVSVNDARHLRVVGQ